MTWDRDSQVSLRRSVQAARESARDIRDVLSLEAWEEINELLPVAGQQRGRDAVPGEPGAVLSAQVRRATQLVLGLSAARCCTTRRCRFLWLGVMLERAGQTARILDMHHHTMIEEGVREAPRTRGGAPASSRWRCGCRC